MENFKKYCKQNYKKIINIMAISIVLLYIIFNICFGIFNLSSPKHTIVQIMMIVVIFIFTINVRKLTVTREQVKQIAKKTKEIFNKYILVKAIVILLVVKILESLITILINK